MIYELLSLSQVLEAVRSTGTEVRFHAEECKTDKVSGFYRLNANVDRLVICPSNQRNHSDLFDTIRHEAVHVVQACKGDAIMPYDYWLQNATNAAKQSVSEYPSNPRVQHWELEAFSIAEMLDEQDVITLINKYCFE